jgi:cytoskeleton protein RodZ
LDEVGDSLNLAAARVALIEADDYSALPAAAFTQGYIRNYAKLVGLDADALVGAYQHKAGVPTVAWKVPKRAALIDFAELMERHPGMLLGGVVAAVGLLVLVVLLSVWPEAEDPAGELAGGGEDPSVTPLQAVATEAEPTVEVPRSAASDAALTTQPAARFASPVTSANRNAGSAPGYVEVVDPEAIDPNDPLAHLPIAQTFPSDPATQSEVSVQVPVAALPENESASGGVHASRRITSTGSDVISLNFTTDCWIAVRDEDAALLYNVLGRAGGSLELIGAGPFKLLLGYAPGVALTYNGERIMLAPFTRRDVARVVLGDQ